MDKITAVLEVLQGNAVLVSLLVGSLTPLLISVLQQPTLSDRARKVLATSASVALGVVVAASTGTLVVPADLGDFASIVGVVGAVWASAEAFYQKLWKPAGVAAGLERATSPWVKPEVEVDWDSVPEFETK